MLPLIAALSLWLGSIAWGGNASQKPERSADHIRQVISTLPEFSMLRNELQLGRRGDGVRRPWMNDMQRHAIKEASSAVRISWWKGMRSARVLGLHYFSQYGLPGSEITTEARLQEVARDRVDAELKQVLVDTAILYSSEPSQARPCQQVAISVFDDEWLPAIVAVPDPDGGTETNLEDAVRQETLEQVKALLNGGAQVNQSDICGRTALFDAAAAENPEVCKLLLERGADARVRDENGWTPLMNAAWLGRPEILRLLMNHGAPVDAVDNERQTALMSAVERGNTEAVRVLLAGHPKLSARDNRGQTALSIAEGGGRTDIVGLLRQAGAHD